MSAASKRDEIPVFTMVEEATHLLRRMPATAWLGYFIGTLPFLICLFFFWSDMSRSAAAKSRLAEMSLLLSALYGWMKVCQAWFCDRLMDEVRGRHEAEPLPFRGWMRLIASQLWVHATAPWVLVVSLFALVPLPWTYSFYHNFSCLAVDHYRHGGRTWPLVKLAMHQTHWQPMQNVFLMALLKVVALFVYLNLFAGFALGANLLKSFTGVENPFTMNFTLFFSLVFQAMLLMGCYIVMNPFVKAIYVLRCFYGAARKSGADIGVQLRMLAVAKPLLLAVCAFTLFQGTLGAQAPAANVAEVPPSKVSKGVNSDQLNQSIKDVLQDSEFQWRMPRDNQNVQDDSWLGRQTRAFSQWMEESVDKIGEILGDIFDWIFGGKKSEDDLMIGDGAGSSVWMAMMPQLVTALGGVLLLVLVILLIRNWQQNRLTKVVEADAALPEVNLESENVVATQLPENEWLRLAREKMAAGDLRLALRALFLATLAHLGDKRLLHISRSKSNGDYVRELNFRARGRDDLSESFRTQVRTFDRVWYGWHEVTRDLMSAFEEQHERITSHAS